MPNSLLGLGQELKIFLFKRFVIFDCFAGDTNSIPPRCLEELIFGLCRLKEGQKIKKRCACICCRRSSMHGRLVLRPTQKSTIKIAQIMRLLSLRNPYCSARGYRVSIRIWRSFAPIEKNKCKLLVLRWCGVRSNK